MNKVGIITINGNSNYGNRLQNYALQESIKMLGFECETIRHKRSKSGIIGKKLYTFIYKDMDDKYNTIIKRIKERKTDSSDNIKLDIERTKIFKQFTDKYINETNFEIEVGNVDNSLSNQYEYFVVGSDQIWNPNLVEVSEVSFLTFAPKEKRVSYAPSFGISNIPKNYRRKYKIWLSEIPNISVREDAGRDIVKNITDRDVDVVIDPTMLLTKEKWLSIAKKAKFKPKKKYILTYFLGGIPEQYRNHIEEISNKNNLEIVNLADRKYVESYVTGPSEFIDYINSASVFYTDSFHGCVFSLLLETPFVVCKRQGQSSQNSMESRIDTFVDKFNLNSRRYDKIIDNDILNCDYEVANNILAVERAKAMQFLKKSLNISE